MRTLAHLFGVLALVLIWAVPAAALTIDFEGGSLVHGRVVTTDEPGLTISATNVGGGPDLAIIYNTQVGDPSDPDLNGPLWDAGGNLGTGVVLNNVLILQENATGCGDDICDNPDDEGTRPAGTIQIDLDQSYTDFGFDLLDVEGAVEFGNASFTASILFQSGGVNVTVVNFADLTALAGFSFGNHRVNRADPGDLGIAGSFNTVIFKFGGSGAIDNLVFVPEPSSALLLGGTLLGIVGLLRRIRR